MSRLIRDDLIQNELQLFPHCDLHIIRSQLFENDVRYSRDLQLYIQGIFLLSFWLKSFPLVQG